MAAEVSTNPPLPVPGALADPVLEEGPGVKESRNQDGGEQQRRVGQDPGLERVVQHRHLHDQAGDALRCEHRDLEGGIGP